MMNKKFEEVLADRNVFVEVQRRVAFSAKAPGFTYEEGPGDAFTLKTNDGIGLVVWCNPSSAQPNDPKTTEQHVSDLMSFIEGMFWPYMPKDGVVPVQGGACYE